MATDKKTETIPEVVPEVVPEAVPEVTPKAAPKAAPEVVPEESPMDYIPFFLHRDPRNQEKGKFVSVNQIKMFVPFGQQVMIPRCIAEVLERSLTEDEATAQKLLALAEKSKF